jgi:hypothetical protein
MMCVEGSSPKFPSNFGLSEGSFLGIFDHEGLWPIGSSFNHDRSRKYYVTRKGRENEYWEGDEVFVIPDEPCDEPCVTLHSYHQKVVEVFPKRG